MKSLLKKGLIRRRASVDDQRAQLISITKKGADLVNAVARFSEAEYVDIEARLGAKKLDQLYRLLAELEEKI